ncbi:fumarate hydratase [Pollutimonas nitritireducens]|uniref:Fumarate hydratase class I n=1 Tax=Pollutimonas nitritireducens TaxID=2045209 RepID=A0A2N4UE93_9BURK|nr:fumarate hydratase [Pollutimonas nitritireducens]PLC53342.1 fumarate hydratase [Pollutimonas nitritireducens]
MTPRTIRADDLVDSIADALQFMSYYHPADFVQSLKRAYESETHGPARNALLQILINSKLCAAAHRPVCQDTGVVHVFFRMGMDVRIHDESTDITPSLQALANRAVARAYRCKENPLRASIVLDPLGARTNTRDNTPAVVHIEMIEGNTIGMIVAAKGGGGDVKARYTMLNPSDSVADWVVSQLPNMGAGWCPPGVLGIGVGGSPEQAMLMAKRALFSPIDMHVLQAAGPQNPLDALRLDIFERINALGIGAQGLGGNTTVLDIKIEHAASHAALLPVAIIPNCAATRFVRFELDGSGVAQLVPPPLSLWDDIPDALPGLGGRSVDLDTLTPGEVATWRAGDTLLLSGTLLTARDAAHKRLADLLERRQPLPVDLRGRAIYYVGPVDPIEGEAVGPAGPTTSTRMDKFMPALLEQTGLLVTIGKAERGPTAIEAIRRAGAAYLMAVGGAAYLISKAVRSARVVAFEDLGMEAIYEFTVENMPVVVAVDSDGRSVHKTFFATVSDI